MASRDCPVSTLVTVISTPGKTAPVVSVAFPDMVAVAPWANSGLVATLRTTAIKQAARSVKWFLVLLMKESPSCYEMIDS
jgi:hypothetical protein